MSTPSQGDIGGNPPVPRSRENGGRRDGLNPELVEHRLNQLEQTAKENKEDIADIKTTVTKIKEGMITKRELILALISVLAITTINLIVWMTKS